MLLASVPQPLAQAMREEQPRYAASTYALCEAVQYGIGLQRKKQRAPGAGTVGNANHVPKLYKNLEGEGGLVEGDPAWERLERADHTGFRGLTSYTFVRAASRKENFSEVPKLPTPHHSARLETRLANPNDHTPYPDRRRGSFDAIETRRATHSCPQMSCASLALRLTRWVTTRRS